MKYSKSMSFFLLFLGLFSVTMNLYNTKKDSLRGPSSVVMVENEGAANATPPWWITH